jgi:membrane protein implicated in regulation of membrane protease activity
VTPFETAVAALACVVAIVAGVTMLWGLPAALISAGAIGLVIVVLLYDPKARRRKPTPEQLQRQADRARIEAGKPRRFGVVE